MIEFIDILKGATSKDASDIHFKFGKSPFYRIKTELVEVANTEILTDESLEKIAFSIMSPAQKEAFLSEMDIDLAYESEGAGRFRINLFKQRGHIGLVMRRIKNSIPSFAQLSLPKVLEKISSHQDGLILVVGPTGCGKSTTLAAMIEYINTNQFKHVVTIEDPIEYIYEDKNCIINQRDVGLDTLSFNAALKHVLREDPDIILIGELRDVETFEAAVRASETGHLVFGTLHTTDTITTISRIMDFFPQSQHAQIRKIIAYNLKAIVCQKLLPRKDGNGLVPVCEILLVTPIVSRLIIDDKISKLSSAIIAGQKEGMQTFNHNFVRLIKDDIITKEVGFASSPSADSLEMNLRGIYIDEETILGD